MPDPAIPAIPDLASWRSLVEKTLRGASFDRRMTRSLPGGLTLPALQTERPTSSAESELVRALSRDGRWDVCALHHPGEDGCVAAVEQDLQRGVDSVCLAGAATTAQVERVLASIPLIETGVVWSGGVGPAERLAALEHAATQQGVEPARLWGSIGADPFAAHLASGAELPTSADLDAVASVTRDRPKHLQTLSITGMAAREAGGSAVTELGALLASGAATLRALTQRGLTVEDIAAATRLTVGIGRDQLTGIALLRAARLGWARLCAAFGTSDAGATRSTVHGMQLACWQTRHDPWVNLLRSTLAGFVGAVGGADAITLLPYDAPGAEDSVLGRRMATNTQLLLAEESHLGMVRDPAAGSYTLEHLTLSLAREAWSVLQSIEAAGGLEAEAGRAVLVERVRRERAEMGHALDRRRAALVGVSDFPGAADQVLPAASSEPGTAPLAPIRHAQAWEDLRDAGHAHPQVGPVFLATWGPLSRHSARAMFTSNALAAGGLSVVDPGGLDQLDTMVAAFRASGASAAVICGADADYPTVVPGLARALSDAGAASVWVAGRGGEHEAAWRAAGVSDFLYMGCDVRGLLVQLHATLSIPTPE